VLPQNWLFMSTFSDLRERVLRRRVWRMLAWLGAGAFETVGGHVVQVVLLVSDSAQPSSNSNYSEILASAASKPAEKAHELRSQLPRRAAQLDQLRNPSAVV